MTKETELREHSRFATFRKGTSNKFYQVRVVEREDTCADVLLTYGRIGTAGQTKKTLASYFERGVEVVDTKFSKKLGKGYVEQKSALILLAMTMEEPEERKGNGLPLVDVQFVMPSVSASLESRLDKFATKYLSKLNLIRKDYYALSRKQFGKQIEDLGRQFTAEFDRILASKGYGAEASENDVIQAVIYYYRALREETKLPAIYWPMRNFGVATGIYD
jgi:predicted DNA-binding WGR domain protein